MEYGDSTLHCFLMEFTMQNISAANELGASPLDKDIETLMGKV